MSKNLMAVVPNPVKELAFGLQHLAYWPSLLRQKSIFYQERPSTSGQLFERRMLPILDTKWWPSIALILFEVFLRRVRQEARSDKQGRVWSLCFTPRKEILKYSRWHALFVVLAVHEPRFETLGSVNVFSDLLAHD